MKPTFFKSIFLALAVIICFSVCAFAADTGPDPMTVMATMAAAPAGVIVAAFDIENLKIPIEEYRALKAKYKHIYVIDVKMDEDEEYQFIVCRPSRDLLSAIADAKNDDEANELILKNMILAGDTDALDDGLVFGGLMKELSKLMKSAQGFLKKA